MLTVGSLFAGIGGFDLGFERAGMRTLWQVEQNEFCRRVLAKHFPNAHQFIDVRHVTGDPKRWADEGGCLLEYVDVLCGGFPCQDISLAGRGAGIEGERSGLWGEYARLIGELRPRYVVVENVAALLGRGLDRVLGDLAALGYDAEWDCLPASAFGAPHRRDRIWLVAYPSGEPGRLAEHRSGGQGRQSADPREPALVRQGDRASRAEGLAPCDRARDVAYPASSGLEGSGLRGRSALNGASLADTDDLGRERPGQTRNGRAGLEDRRRGARAVGNADSPSPDALAAPSPPREGAGESGWWATEPDVGRVAHGVPARVDRLAALGNALVPQVAEWIGRRIIEWEEGGIAA